MEASNIIESGLLEAYAMGLASPDEQQVVEKALMEYKEVKLELEEIEMVLESMAMRFALNPDSKIKNSLENELFRKQIHINTPGSAINAPIQRSMWNSISIAATVAALILGGIAIFENQKIGTVEKEIAGIRKESADLQLQNQSLSDGLNKMRGLASTLSEEGSRQVILTSTQSQPSKAIVFWNPTTHKVWLVNTSLPQLPDDKQYQLWGIVGGQPVDAGVFDGQKAGNDMMAVELKSITKPSLFAVTVENRGGSPTPTLSTMCLKAEI